MSVLNVIQKRGSIRQYQDTPIAANDLQAILESARLAQSAANRQPWQFIVVTTSSLKKGLIPAARNQQFVGDAAAVIVCLADPAMSAKVGPFDGFLIDLAIAIENMALVAWDLGVGSCWIGAYTEKEVKQLLNIPDNLRVVSLLTLGYPAHEPRAKNRKPLHAILHYEQYGQTN